MGTNYNNFDGYIKHDMIQKRYYYIDNNYETDLHKSLFERKQIIFDYSNNGSTSQVFSLGILDGYKLTYVSKSEYNESGKLFFQCESVKERMSHSIIVDSIIINKDSFIEEITFVVNGSKINCRTM
jgi:hypothetical protein